MATFTRHGDTLTTILTTVVLCFMLLLIPVSSEETTKITPQEITDNVLAAVIVSAVACGLAAILCCVGFIFCCYQKCCVEGCVV